MKKTAVIVIMLFAALAFNSALAAEGGEKGASAKAYEHASEQAIFHRVSDWFSTIGKSSEEKAKILEERRAKRALKRLEKETIKAQRKTGTTREKTKRKLKMKTKGQKGKK